MADLEIAQEATDASLFPNMKSDKICNIRISIIGYAIIVGCLFMGCKSLQKNALPDEALLAIFVKHKDSFVQLEKMTLEGSQQGWITGFVDSKKLPILRRKQYEELASQIGCGVQILMDKQDNIVRFAFASGADSPFPTSPEWLKGIEYIPLDDSHKYLPGDLITNLNNVSNLSAGEYLRQIDKEWFLFYQKSN